MSSDKNHKANRLTYNLHQMYLHTDYLTKKAKT